MAIIKTTQAGNPIIHTKSSDVIDVASDETHKVITDLVDTMREEDLVGMAAAQIGKNVRIFITEVRETQYRKEGIDELRIFINPKLVNVSESSSDGYEGCGSVASAQFFGPVSRADSITIEALDKNGEKFTFEANDFLARVIQHELDHLDGILFHEKITDMKKVMSKEEYVKTRGK
jgi:peptide deformylase